MLLRKKLKPIAKIKKNPTVQILIYMVCTGKFSIRCYLNCNPDDKRELSRGRTSQAVETYILRREELDRL